MKVIIFRFGAVPYFSKLKLACFSFDENVFSAIAVLSWLVKKYINSNLVRCSIFYTLVLGQLFEKSRYFFRFEWQKDPRHLRRRFGQFGLRASGVNPGICWPTKAEVEEEQKLDDIFHADFFASLAEHERREKAEADVKQARYA